MQTGIPLSLEVAEATEVGDRVENQDACAHLVAACGAFLVLCDGMGGHSGGGLAARLFTEAVLAGVERSGAYLPDDPLDAVAAVVREAAAVMGEGARRRGPALDPHTTAVMAWVGERRTVVANVGDSRAYHLGRGGVRWRSRDHSFVQELVDAGAIGPEEAPHHPYRNLVLRSVGGATPPEPEVTVLPPLEVGEVLLLCSDGVWEYVPDAELPPLADAPDLPAALKALVRRAVERGRPHADNATALAVRRAVR